ncbi:MAG: thiamine pyrophosphate-dependent enzyme [bacterium]|jgi:indolepyruvate ferredoxin oxidoreductase alpha subunit|nr:thiamine pyrophosphate-dependent enzyme [bacterium]
MNAATRRLLSGNEAIALAAMDAGVHLGIGYPGTPSTEILEAFSLLKQNAQWAPNEKVALEVGIGASYAGGRSLVTMKHVGVNVAADPLFTVTYTGVQGALVLISADDPGMASSQNEQDNRHYAVAAGIPMLEPADSQEAYDFTLKAIEISEQWHTPVMLRVTTRVCHSKTIVKQNPNPPAPVQPNFERDIQSRVMIPAYARPAHRKLRQKLRELQAWNETSGPNKVHDGESTLGIITSGISFVHAQEAAPNARILKLGMTYPLPIAAVKQFAASVDRCLVIEEGDPYLVDAFRAEGIAVEGKDEMYRYGELNVNRVRKILAGDTTPEAMPPKGRPPQLCEGCPHRYVFTLLGELDCIVTGDIGCYTLGVLPPFNAMDTCVCMGASIGVGRGMRDVLPEEQARRVVSVIGDSTFIHSGITGVVDMVYNPPKTGHVLMILDNGTTAMTGLQEHPGTGRSLDHHSTNQVVLEDVCRAIGIKNVDVINPMKTDEMKTLVQQRLASNELSVIIARRPCILAAPKITQYERAAAQECGCSHECAETQT